MIEQKFTDLAKVLDENVVNVITSDALIGFQKAYQIADATGKLKTALTNEYMTPIMDLQGNKLGFKTDKDAGGGYQMDVVKNCLIEAVLTGVQPFGNHFNIIAGNMYITKEGFGYLLKNITGLSYEIIPSLPRIDAAKGSAAINMKIRWQFGNGAPSEREIDFAIKVNQYMGADAVIGKATRKARKWLHDTITGFEIADGDIGDVNEVKAGTKLEVFDPEELRQLFEDKRALCDPDEIKMINRILNGNEKESYSKVADLLRNKSATT